MANPESHAAVILRWMRGKTRAQVERELNLVKDGHLLLLSAERVGDAADSDDPETRSAGLEALFAGLIEPLNDSFTPAGRAVYARLFPHIAWRVISRQPALAHQLASFGITSEAELLERYRRARAGVLALPEGPVKRVVVLSRVTIGADILITSVALRRLRQRFPEAEMVLVGDAKLAGLFGGMAGVRVHPLTYSRRGPLRERLSSWVAVAGVVRVESPDLVVSPDSRLDQLGVLPVIEDPHRYLLWENTQPEGRPPRSLADLYDEWLAQCLSLPAQPLLPTVALDGPTTAMQQRLCAALGDEPIAAVKLDHGGNPAKALPREAEVALLQRLAELGWRILLDRGFGGDELANSDSLLRDLGWTATDLDDSGRRQLGQPVMDLQPGELKDKHLLRFHGSIAGWAAALTCCKVAVSYDSVGHHLAAALGIPVVVAFTGYSDPSFPIAWQPRGPASVTMVTIPIADKDQPEQWQPLFAALPSS